MNPEHWQETKALFDAALPLSEDERADLLDTSESAPEIVQRVRAMLRADERGGEALERDRETAERALRALGGEPGLDGVGAYEFLEPLGRGGMGAVFRARRRDVPYAPEVAVKILRPGLETTVLMERFAREREALGELEHPNIARLLDAGEAPDGRPYFVMELVDGVTLDRYCEREGLDLRERIRIFREVCAAVAHAHEHLIVHRDIKPANVLVDGRGTPKLLDFGIAKALVEGGVTLTEGQAPFTLEYASPEQVRGDPVSTASDVYSLGVVLFELVTGTRPFENDTRSRIDHLAGRREPPVASRRSSGPRSRRLRGELDAVIAATLRDDPRERTGSVRLLDDDLGRWLSGFPVEARPRSAVRSFSRLLARNKIASALVTGSLVALIGTAIFAYREAKLAKRANVELVRAREEEETARLKAERTAAFLREMLSSVQPERDGREVTVMQVLEEASARAELELAEQPDLWADVARTLAESYAALGMLDDAQREMQRSLELLESLYGKSDTRYADGLNSMAVISFERGETTRAIELLEEALETMRSLHGPLAEETVNVKANLASLWNSTGENARAEEAQRDVLTARIELAGARSLPVAETLNNLANCLRLQGEVEEAREHLERSLEIRRELLPEDHPLVLQSLGNLGVLCAGMEDMEAALPLLQEVAQRTLAKLGPDHPDLAVSLSNVASIARRTDRLEVAEEAAREALRIRREVLPPGAFLTHASEWLLATVLALTGEREEAQTLLESCLPVYERGFGPDAPETQRIRELQAELADE